MLKVLILAVGVLAGGPAMALTSQDVESWDFGGCEPMEPPILGRIAGLSYGDARPQLLTEGWSPIANPDLAPGQQGVWLEEYRKVGWIEVEDCSADDYCRMNFSIGGDVLRIITHADQVEGGGLICPN